MEWKRLLPELSRGLLSVGFGVVLVFPVIVLVADDTAEQSSVLDSVVVFLALYLIAYCLLTSWVFFKVENERIAEWARTTTESGWVQRFILATQPGPGIALTASAMGLVAGVFWIPQSDRSQSWLPPTWQTILAVSLVVGAWATVLLTYSVAYLCQDIRHGQKYLDFPGESEPVWTDYLYFSSAVSMTFGATDVSVQAAPMRQRVTGHTLVAFFFNTVILAALVGAIVE